MPKLSSDKLVLENLQTGVYIYDAVNQNNEYINKQYTKITGWNMKELNSMGEKFMELFHPDDKEAIIAHMGEVLGSKKDDPVEIEYRFKHKNGNWVWCLSYDTPLQRDKSGKVTKFIGSFVDISKRKEAESGLKESRDRHMKLTKMFTGVEEDNKKLRAKVQELEKKLQK